MDTLLLERGNIVLKYLEILGLELSIRGLAPVPVRSPPCLLSSFAA